ncbi:MAG: LytTR family DNA-binding domain-containing protein [Bacteroidota bacterium]
MKIRCIVVDDEPLAVDILTSYVKKVDSLELLGSMNNAIEAFNFLAEHEVDLVFLDIQMPKITGLDLLKNLSKKPQVVFTTAYREYALDGYDFDIIDYLLKPISFDRFLKSVNRYMQRTSFEKKPQPDAFVQQESVGGDVFIYLKADKKMVKIYLKDILYIESLKDYIRVKTDQKSVVTYQRISFMEEKLPPNMFLRVHRSFITSLSKVEAFCGHFVEVSGKEIPIGRNYRQHVLAVLNKQNILTD